MPMPEPAGVIAAIITPVLPDGSPDHARFVRHARWLMSNGCDGLNVLGTTGEATSFSFAARTALMAAAASAVNPARLMVGTGCPDLDTTIRLTRAACQLGYGAALVLPPYYYKGVSDQGLYDYFAALVDGTRETPIAIYLYNFPQMTGLTLSPELVHRLAKDFPGRLRGAKDSSGDLVYAAELATISGFRVFPSDESTLALARGRGFSGCISATVNLSAPLAQRLWQAPEDTGLLAQVRAVRGGISAQPLIPAVKHLVAQLHDDPDFARVLAPFVALTAAQSCALLGLLQSD